MEQRYAFVAEWYDPHASMTRRYQLLYYPGDNTCEMIDIKNRRLFLKRSKCDNVHASDLFIGAIVNVLSRQLTIVEFGDEYTSNALRVKIEKTLGVIKPDCLPKMAAILDRALSSGFVLCHAKMVQLSHKEASEFYREEESDNPSYRNMVSFMAEGPVLAFEIMGESVIERWQEALGPANPALARQKAPASIRAQFGTDPVHNACHGSSSYQSAEREIQFFFGSKPRGKNTATYTNCTLGIIKPHAIKSGMTTKILNEIEAAGLTISSLQMFHVEKANTEEFYEVYKGVVREYSSMVEQLCSGPCIAMEITGPDAQQVFRELTGPVDPEIARHLRPHTLRAKFGVDKIKNALHCTDLPDDGLLEVEYFFKILDS